MNTQLRGITFITLSAFFYASYGIWTRLMSGTFGEFTQAWTRGLMALLIILSLNIFFHFLKPIRRQDFRWFLVIGLLGGLNQAPYYLGFEKLNLGTAILLFYASLVASGYVMGKLFFKEKFGVIKLTSQALSLIGMGCLYRFSIQPAQLFAASAMVLAGFMGGTGVVLTKKLSGTYSELQIIMSYLIIMVPANSFIALRFHETIPAFTHLIAWLGQFGYLTAYLTANLAAIEGFRHMEPSVGSIVGLIEILFGVLFGCLFFHEALGISTFIGGILIVFAAALPNLNDLILWRRKASPARSDPAG